MEYREPITYTPKNNEEMRILSSLQGFYGILTPDMGNKIPRNLIEFFVGNGYIQGVFFHMNNTNSKTTMKHMTFTKTYIQTEKLLFLQNPILFLWRLLRMSRGFHIPNLLGVANTAFLHIINEYNIPTTFALFERDKPYQIDIDIDNRKINTIGRLEETPLVNFLAHPKRSLFGDIETLDYRPFQKSVYYYRLEENLIKVIQKIAIPTQHHPIIHDFVSLIDEIIFFDTSYFSRKTVLIRCNKRTSQITRIPLPEWFYIFHYAKWRETDERVEIYACLYDSINMFSLGISGKYRKIILDKRTNIVSIERNTVLESYNLDFPISLKNERILLRNIDGTKINGFVICKELEIIKTILFVDGDESISICGEPCRVEINDEEYVIFMTYHSKNSYEGFNGNEFNGNTIVIYRIHDDWNITIPIREQLAIGLHSVFIQ